MHIDPLIPEILDDLRQSPNLVLVKFKGKCVVEPVGYLYDERGPLATTYTLRAQAGRRYRLRQITSMVPDLMHQDPMRHAVRFAYFGPVQSLSLSSGFPAEHGNALCQRQPGLWSAKRRRDSNPVV